MARLEDAFSRKSIRQPAGVHLADDGLADRLRPQAIAPDALFEGNIEEADFDLGAASGDVPDAGLVRGFEVRIVDDHAAPGAEGRVEQHVPRTDDELLARFAPPAAVEHRAEVILINALVALGFASDQIARPGRFPGAWQALEDDDDLRLDGPGGADSAAGLAHGSEYKPPGVSRLNDRTSPRSSRKNVA